MSTDFHCRYKDLKMIETNPDKYKGLTLMHQFTIEVKTIEQNKEFTINIVFYIHSKEGKKLLELSSETTCLIPEPKATLKNGAILIKGALQGTQHIYNKMCKEKYNLPVDFFIPTDETLLSEVTKLKAGLN